MESTAGSLEQCQELAALALDLFGRLGTMKSHHGLERFLEFGLGTRELFVQERGLELPARGDLGHAQLLVERESQELEAAPAAHPNARDVVWVQEEPANMGAQFFVQPRIERLLRRPIRSVKRSASGSPATGSAKAHGLEQQTLLTLAFTTGA